MVGAATATVPQAASAATSLPATAVAQVADATTKRASQPTAVPATVAAAQPATLADADNATTVADAGNATTIAGQVYTQANTSIVSITVTESQVGPRGIPSQAQGEGSGIILDTSGHILTNAHVVSGANSVTVAFADGTQSPAKVVTADTLDDLAVVQLVGYTGTLRPATLGDSDAVKVGDPVVAIGTPFGLEHTVTSGIISGVGRTFDAGSGKPLNGLLQTDAPINPGNSGGALFNAHAQVIGITTAIESPVRGSVGVGFAIPINEAKALLPKLLAGQSVQHPFMGIGGLDITPAIAKQLGVSVTSGVLVTSVQPGGPAAKAGLIAATDNGNNPPTGGDIIVAVDGHAVSKVAEISSYLATKAVGDTVSVTIIRDGKQQSVNVILGDWPAQQTTS
jgi:putative serine protease PepD